MRGRLARRPAYSKRDEGFGMDSPEEPQGDLRFLADFVIPCQEEAPQVDYTLSTPR